jgi:hypothetical protein
MYPPPFALSSPTDIERKLISVWGINILDMEYQ